MSQKIKMQIEDMPLQKYMQMVPNKNKKLQ